VIVSVLVGGAILFPSLALLFRLALTGRLKPADTAPPEDGASALRRVRPRLLARSAGACLIAGFGLLNVADARWAHGVGIVCLLSFVVLGFRAIIFTALSEQRSAD
jgi:cytochrome d ubiquinol oxidase subunit II